MKKLFSLSVFFLVSAPLLFANVSAYNKDTCPIGQNDGVSRASKKRKLNAFGNLTFFKDFTSVNNDKNPSNILRADYSKGLGTATFTATRSASAPATYVDSRGVVQLVTSSNTPRFAGGYYDETGFHSVKGLMIEGARTNILRYTNGSYALWEFGGSRTGVPTLSNVSIPELQSFATAQSQRIVYTGVAGDAPAKDISAWPTMTAVGSIANGNVITESFWIRSQTGLSSGVTVGAIMYIYNAAAGYLNASSGTNIAASIGTSWKRFSHTYTVVDATASRTRTGISIGGITEGKNIDIEIANVQLEIGPYPTSFIPTGDAPLTRGAEVLKYAISGNRTAATETCVFKIMPLGGGFVNDGIIREISSTDTKARRLFKNSTAGTVAFRPNSTDSGISGAVSSTSPSVNTSYVFTGVAYGPTEATNVQIYLNGASQATDADDYTSPAWGDYFYLGTSESSLSPLNGLIQSVAFFSETKSSTYVENITNILKS